MSQLFLGRWWHWFILIACIGLLWFAGFKKMHVIHFNWFVILLILATGAVVALLSRTTQPSDRITRDHIVINDDVDRDDA